LCLGEFCALTGGALCHGELCALALCCGELCALTGGALCRGVLRSTSFSDSSLADTLGVDVISVLTVYSHSDVAI